MTTLQAVLLSGGSGTRLWPLSREAYPKQFLPLVGDGHDAAGHRRRVAGLADARAARGRQRGAPLPGRRAAAPSRVAPTPRSCSSRSAATPRRRSPRRRCRQWPTATTRCCWCCRPTTSIADAEGVPRRGARCRGRGAGGRAGDLRHRADRPGNRLRLHPGGAAAGRATGVPRRSRASSRSPTPGPRTAYLDGRRLLLEQRHVPVQGLALPGRARALPPGHRWRRRAPRSAAARRDGDFVRLDKDAFAACPSTRSTTR